MVPDMAEESEATDNTDTQARADESEATEEVAEERRRCMPTVFALVIAAAMLGAQVCAFIDCCVVNWYSVVVRSMIDMYCDRHGCGWDLSTLQPHP